MLNNKLNNNDDDYLTSMTMSMLLNDRINRKIRSMESKGGVLNGEFIKKHLERETELEEKIYALEEQIKNMKNVTHDDSKGYYSKDSVYYSILQGMIPYMSISLSHEDEVMRVNVDDCPINGQLAKYLESLRKEYEHESMIPWGMPILNNSKSPYVLNIDYGNESDLTTKVTAAIPEKWGNNLTDVIDTCGIGGRPK